MTYCSSNSISKQLPPFGVHKFPPVIPSIFLKEEHDFCRRMCVCVCRLSWAHCFNARWCVSGVIKRALRIVTCITWLTSSPASGAARHNGGGGGGRAGRSAAIQWDRRWEGVCGSPALSELTGTPERNMTEAPLFHGTLCAPRTRSPTSDKLFYCF